MLFLAVFCYARYKNGFLILLVEQENPMQRLIKKAREMVFNDEIPGELPLKEEVAIIHLSHIYNMFPLVFLSFLPSPLLLFSIIYSLSF